ncbi:hypothetical protein A6V39_01665 [Candidatus Mycoplasma haematobovis]|uniref:YqaJ viral recombinase domain-containing protein n=1 Tax=Candidatus Mycoplasma haematobovis TaxID=432608 RepID=A0A1A9QGA6_9MOLU|nr:hypothetical protein [Candidatus Mycoplasma haematobovis]OAL10750.1 hypothetical protein A6V39_01665 [Candidatus Mycoplasma haematobovis]
MFLPDRDFFIKEKRVLLTRAGRERVRSSKITGTKIPFFFDLKYSPFMSWARINNFYEISKDPKAWERYLINIEFKIRGFVNDEINMDFKGYSPDRCNVFDHEVFGGVPDGEEFDANGKVTSILEIKTPHWKKPNTVDIYEFLLQLGLYLYLRNLDEGYLCVAFLGMGEVWKRKDEHLDLFLTDFTELEPFFKVGRWDTLLPSQWKEFNNSPFGFDILESKKYTNSKYEIHLMKVKIDMEKYGAIMKKFENWYWKHKHESPDLDVNQDTQFVKEAWNGH